MNLFSKHKILLILGLFLLHFLISSCTKAVLEESPSQQITSDTIKYDPDIKLIMTNNCIVCHGGSSPSAGLNLNNYNNVRDKVEQGSLLSRINNVSSPMPPSGLMDETKRETIRKWKTDGYLE